MPVTEFVSFRFKAPHTLHDDDVRSNFQKVSSWQSEWSKYPLTFYNAVDDPSVVYLVSGWEDVEAHMKWIESEKNQTLLKIFEPILSIIDFAHLEIDFTMIPSDTKLLVYRKGAANDGEERSTIWLDTDAERFEIWSGQGKAVEGGEVYYFKAYGNFESLSLSDDRWKLMRRIYF
jgi:hypothetical protein